jgi:molybdate transport system substrate-binding protein
MGTVGTRTVLAALLAAGFVLSAQAQSAELRLLTTGAFRPVALALVPDFERQTGNKVAVTNDTAGGVKARIEKGESYDVAVATPKIIDELARDGKIQEGSETKLANVGVGVAVKDGAPKPDIGTIEAFKQALLNARSVAYIDPKSGGSSGIYVDKLLERLGVADQIRPKAKLKQGGHVADLIVDGTAELGIQQISEIVPVKGVVLVGPLPKEIQNVTTYAAGVTTASANKEAAAALLNVLGGPKAAEVLKSKGMEPAS